MKKLITLLTVFSLTSCATILDGSTQRVDIDTIPHGRLVSIDGLHRQTPTHYDLERNSEGYEIFYANGANYKTEKINSEFQYTKVLLGNAIFLFLPGILVDMATGAAYELESNKVIITK